NVTLRSAWGVEPATTLSTNVSESLRVGSSSCVAVTVMVWEAPTSAGVGVQSNTPLMIASSGMSPDQVSVQGSPSASLTSGSSRKRSPATATGLEMVSITGAELGDDGSSRNQTTGTGLPDRLPLRPSTCP